jgi:D-alanyl-D-alanine carboxypeptidase (penicillin-binding protein 5/6)
VSFRPPQELQSTSVYVYHMDTGIAVYSKNADKQVFPASTTKIMTTILALEHASLDSNMEVTFDATNEFWGDNPNFHEAAGAGLQPGQTNLTYRDAIYGLMLPSGCDAANALAYSIGGDSIENFVKMMNDKAKEIGAVNTNFTNPHGLFEPEHVSTAYDMFLITKYAYEKHEIFFSSLVNTEVYTMPPNGFHPDFPSGYPVRNSNWLIRTDDANDYYYDFALGTKTGGFDYYYTKNSEGGWTSHDGLANLVSTARRAQQGDNFNYIVVTMGAPIHLEGRWLHNAFNDHINLYDWAFRTFDYMRAMQKNEPVGSVRVIDGDIDELILFPEMSDDFWTLLPKDIDMSVIHPIVDIPEKELTAPIAGDAVLGTIEIRLANESLGKWSLTPNGVSVELSREAEAIGAIRDVFGSWWFIPLLVLIGVAVIALIILSYVRKHRKNLRQKYGKRKPPNRRIRR